MNSHQEDDIWMTTSPITSNAKTLLAASIDCIGDRAIERDTDAERSMAACVRAFNEMFDKDLTETEGWQFMVLLKMSRAKGGDFRRDDFIDQAAYSALAGEAAAAELN